VAKVTGDSKEYKTSKGSSLYILIICTLLYMVNYMDRQVVAAFNQLTERSRFFAA